MMAQKCDRRGHNYATRRNQIPSKYSFCNRVWRRFGCTPHSESKRNCPKFGRCRANFGQPWSVWAPTRTRSFQMSPVPGRIRQGSVPPELVVKLVDCGTRSTDFHRFRPELGPNWTSSAASGPIWTNRPRHCVNFPRPSFGLEFRITQHQAGECRPSFVQLQQQSGTVDMSPPLRHRIWMKFSQHDAI